jgi:membrane-associated phospholipid phosphatase
LNFLTDFADQAVVLPLAAVVCVLLAAFGWRRGAVAWALSVGGVLAVMLVFKLVVFACGWRVPWTGLSSPSGHTAASAVVYGGLLSLAAAPSVAGTVFAAMAGGLVALLFGLTRLALHVHTVADVVCGAAVGVAGAVLMRRFAGAPPRRPFWRRLVLAICTVALLFHGRRLEAETRIRWLALDVWPLSACKEPGRPHAGQVRDGSGPRRAPP